MPAKPSSSRRWARSSVARRRPATATRLTAGLEVMGWGAPTWPPTPPRRSAAPRPSRGGPPRRARSALLAVRGGTDAAGRHGPGPPQARPELAQRVHIDVEDRRDVERQPLGD